LAVVEMVPCLPEVKVKKMLQAAEEAEQAEAQQQALTMLALTVEVVIQKLMILLLAPQVLFPYLGAVVVQVVHLQELLPVQQVPLV
jgi:hypothetical protein